MIIDWQIEKFPFIWHLSWKAKVRKDRISGALGPFGIGETNDRGERFIEFCKKHDFIISSAYSEQKVQGVYETHWEGHIKTKLILSRLTIDTEIVLGRLR